MLRKLLPLLLLALLLPSSASAQQGIIRIGNFSGATDVAPLNPLLCSNAACRFITDRLYPTLLRTDHENGVLAASDGDDFAAVAGWEVEGDTYIYQLRDDLTWSDGTPLTAYDVFYTMRAIRAGPGQSPNGVTLGRIDSVRVLDATTIAVTYDEGVDCRALGWTNIPLVPAHVYRPGWQNEVTTFFDSGGTYAEWEEAEEELANPYAELRNNAQNDFPTVTAGYYVMDEIRPTEYVRLRHINGAQAIELIDFNDPRDEIQRFLAGELTYIINPPRNRWDDIINAPDVQIYRYPGTVWEAVIFNVADPDEPAYRFDDDGEPILFDEEGEPVVQGNHPIFGDPRVREAFQLALDVPEIIDTAVLGYAQQTPADMLPQSWAYDDNIALPEYNLTEANRLLTEAGWRYTQSRGTRQCVTCLYAEEGDALTITLLFSDFAPRRRVAATLIREHLARAGFAVNVQEGSISAAQDQRFDAYFIGWSENNPPSPDHTALFGTEADNPNGLNIGSYSNERVDELLAQALSMPGCAVEDRAPIYAELQAELQADYPYAWLYVADEMIAVRGGVQNFAPAPNAPLANIHEWVITE